jgi:hypothetical protein
MRVFYFLLILIITYTCYGVRSAEEALWAKGFDDVGAGDFRYRDRAGVVEMFEEIAVGVDFADLDGDIEVGVRGAGHVEDGFDITGDLGV